jgi:hypothetical protein
MILKNKFQPQPLWMLPIAPAGEEWPASKRQELTAALADRWWQLARVSAERGTAKHRGGSSGNRKGTLSRCDITGAPAQARGAAAGWARGGEGRRAGPCYSPCGFVPLAPGGDR